MNTPVAVGAAAVQQRVDDPAVAVEALELMRNAIDAAAVDSGAGGALVAAADAVLVPQGTWSYADPGAMLAARWAPHARSVVAQIGVLQQTLVTRACTAVARGDADVVIVAGGEAKYRSLRAHIAGVDVPETAWTPDTAAVRPERLAPDGEIITRLEVERGLGVPARQYAVMETALRAARVQSVDDHADALAALWACFSTVAATNPDAWRRDAIVPDVLANPSDANPMLAAPYTKLHCSQWNVDQAAAVIVCSADAARRFGVPADRWIFPVAAAESNAMIPLSRRADLGRCPAVIAAGAAVFAAANIGPDDVTHVDLYSCFPSAVQIQAAELGFGLDRPLTITGGMTFAGGPLNNYSLQALAAMVARLRAEPDTYGVLTSVSGMLTKQGVSLWSGRPPGQFVSTDVSAEAASGTPTRDVVARHRGEARVDGYTVVHRDGTPASAIAIATTPAGERCIAVSDDITLAAEMAATEWCGRTIIVRGDHFTA